MTKARPRNGSEARHGGPAGPLADVRVLEFGQIAAGPFTGSLLADLGADVVKVERPDGGDGMRNWPPLTKNATGQEFSENFASLNRNKRSIAVDLKDASQLAALRALCGRTDVIVENFRPGVLARVGLGYEDLARENPRLVYCSISGFGQAGPYAQKGAFDVTVQAISGVMSVTGMPDSEPVKCGVPIGDVCAGLYAAYAIAAQILEVRRSGQGAFIDCSMVGSLIGVSALQTSEYFGTGRAPRRLGSAHPRNAPYQAFRGSDRYFVIAAGNDKLWAQVCESVGLPDLVDDPRFKTQELRAGNQDALVPILQKIFAQRSAAYWLEDMDRRGVPCAPINTYPEILGDQHVTSMGTVADLELPNGMR
ncbi:MAG: CoA transferase, partial [Gammaproteobacteria bacterium]|nr:CoA transferase [Gammaproteobacteria bacterium]NIU05196.1 CoA transferase [Gammaproteobacteria bacterium]NIV52044.1 CoA transferase [Gammaproteobacteria bacterium]NIX86469.1 CoA transferase [Gammaproteobacteria bacterium]